MNWCIFRAGRRTEGWCGGRGVGHTVRVDTITPQLTETLRSMDPENRSCVHNRGLPLTVGIDNDSAECGAEQSVQYSICTILYTTVRVVISFLLQCTGMCLPVNGTLTPSGMKFLFDLLLFPSPTPTSHIFLSWLMDEGRKRDRTPRSACCVPRGNPPFIQLSI
jgi:hypothetical protein